MTQIHWLNPVSAIFNTARDWTGGVIPGASDDAILDAAGADFSVISTTSETVSGIQTAANATLAIIGGTFTAANGTDGGASAGQIEISRGALQVGGTLLNTGVIAVIRARAHDTPTLIIQRSLTLKGGGTVSLVREKGYGAIKGAGMNAVLTNVDNTISGAGYIGHRTKSVVLINEAHGIIDANANGILFLENDRPSINAGLMEATGGGALFIENTNVDNSGGMIEATNAGHVSIFNSGTIIGGGIFAGANSSVAVEAATVSDAVLSTEAGGEIDISDFSTVTVDGVVANAGTIQMGQSADDTSNLILDSAASLTDGGTLSLSPHSTIRGTNETVILTNVDNTVLGGGQLGNGILTLINQAAGVIEGENGVMTIDTGSKTITNAGLIGTAATGSVVIASPVHNSGYLEVDGGTITVDGAVTGKIGTAVINGGTLDFASTFNQDVIFIGMTGELELALSQGYSGRIKGFSATGGTSLDLGDIAFVSPSEAVYSGDTKSGVLTVTDGTHTAQINLRGDYRNAAFTASSDGHGGTIVTASTPPAAAHRFIAAVAGLGAAPAGLLDLAHEARHARPPMLAGPRVTIA